MWALEDDPVLRSSFANLTFADQPIDVPRLRARMTESVEVIRRLRQRVIEPPGAMPPRWEDDPLFDIEFHVRHVALPPPGSDRQVLDLAALLATDPFDRARPLWQMVVVDGLEDGRGALLTRFHHTIVDGEGGVRVSAQFLDLERDATKALALETQDEVEHAGFSPLDAVRKPLGFARRVVEEAVVTVANPLGAPARAGEAVDRARSVLKHVAVTDSARSPIWTERSLRRQLVPLSLPIEAVREAARSLGGSVNDLFVTGAVAAAGAYHRAKGADVDELRMAMPISTRRSGNDESNAFSPTRMLVPVGEMEPVERFKAIQARISAIRAEPGVHLAPALAGVLNALPSPLLLRVARQQVGTVDFTTSNVRGAPFELYVAGAKVLGNHPLGPMAGTAFNLTTLSMGDRLDMGLLCDLAAVDDPALLRACLEEAYRELLTVS